MSDYKKIKKIPDTINIGSGKKKEVYTHYTSLKNLNSANASKKQIKEHVKKIRMERYILDGDKVYSIFVVKND